jgi:uncharacterized SAM-binding protein YcdF (DUF218 family)
MLFVASKILWQLVEPAHLLLILLVTGVTAMLLTRLKRGFTLVVCATTLLAAIAVFPIGRWLARPLEDRFPQPAVPAHVDGIILLSGAVEAGMAKVRGQPVLNEAAERVTATVTLARRFPEARVLATGGESGIIPKGISEAAATRDLLVDLGVAPQRISVEPRARNTWENALFSRQVVEEKPGEVWLLVTSAMHTPRAIGCFRRAGWTVLPYPVDYRTVPWTVIFAPGRGYGDAVQVFDEAVHEWVGLVAYQLLGRTDTLFPAPLQGTTGLRRIEAPEAQRL